jgi:hypothetical protein
MNITNKLLLLFERNFLATSLVVFKKKLRLEIANCLSLEHRNSGYQWKNTPCNKNPASFGDTV